MTRSYPRPPSIREMLEHIIGNQERILYKMAELTEQFKSNLNTIFTGINELSESVGNLSGQLGTVQTEITDEIERLKEAAQAGGGDFTAEAEAAQAAVQKLATVKDALQSVKTGLQALDDLNPDTSPNPGETVEGGPGTDTISGSGGLDANGNPIIGSTEG